MFQQKNLGALLVVFTSLIILTSSAMADDWKRDISLGLNSSNGNSKKTEFALSGAIARALDHALFSGGMNVYYGKSNSTMDTQKWDGNIQYSFDFGSDYDWFNVYKLTVDHDRFSDIDYRATPSVGLGRWLARTDDWTWSVDGSLGYQTTNFRSGAPDENGSVFIAHTFAKKKILENAYLSEDLSIIPSLEGNGTLIKSATVFTNPLSKSMDLLLKYLVDYDSDVAVGTKKTDTRVIAAIKYSF